MHFFIVLSFFFKYLTIVDLLHQNPHWWAPIISSAYGINLDSRMLDKMLYVAGKSDMVP